MKDTEDEQRITVRLKRIDKFIQTIDSELLPYLADKVCAEMQRRSDQLIKKHRSTR